MPKLVVENIARETRVFTDESKLYGDVKIHFVEHSTAKERGMKGIYQHCAEKHTLVIWQNSTSAITTA